MAQTKTAAGRQVQLRHQFPENYNTNEAGDESGLNTGSEGGAQQSFKDECDINTLLKKFGIGYEMPQGLRVPQSGDFTGISDFHGAMNAVRAAVETFEQLPADLRRRFGNDPGEFADFVTNDENRDQVKKWGLLSSEALERDRIAAEQKAAAEATPVPGVIAKPATEAPKPS